MKKWTILLLALLCSTAGAAAQDFSVVNPRCEYRDEPLGINTLTPRFSWQISARDRGFLQSAYELIVGDDRAAVAAGRGNLWRVKAKGAESLHIPYAGKALESGKEYYWSVRSLALDAGHPLLDGADVARRMVGSPLDRHGGAARQPASGAGRGV